jgi:nitrite reductase (NADH) large subunit
MRIVIVGNGLSGTIFAKTLRELDGEAEIALFEGENYPYYPRPNLIEYLAGNLAYERLFAFQQEWYDAQKLRLHLGRRVSQIHRRKKTVELDGGEAVPYEKLLLANGAYAGVPPIQGVEKTGVFTLRTLDDVHAILDYLQDHPRVAVIGGGLLGLEIARAFKTRGAEVDVYEFFPRLLPRQLDREGAAVLQRQIEDTGIAVFCDVATQEITGKTAAQGLRFKDGKEAAADMVVIAAGVRPRIELAQAAGLETDRGIVVNDRLQTSDPDILAAGDSVQHRGRVYGIIPASFQQARTAAHCLLGQDQDYSGTVPSNTLKVVGVDVTSIGLVNPEAEAVEEIRREDPERRIYKKVVLQEGKLKGAIWMGTKQGVNEISRLIQNDIDVRPWKDQILDEDFDFKAL